MVFKVRTKIDKIKCIDAIKEGYTVRQVFFNEDQSFSRQILFYLVSQRCLSANFVENKDRTNLPKDCLVGVSPYVQALTTRKDLYSFGLLPSLFSSKDIEYYLINLGGTLDFSRYLCNISIPFFEILETPASADVVPIYPNDN